MKLLAKAMDFARQNEGSLGRRFFRATMLSSVAYGTKGLIGLVRSIILARLLFPEDFGVLASAAIFVKLVDTLTQTGLTTALIQRKENFDEASSTVFCINIMRGLTLFVLLFASAGHIANFYGIPQIETIVKILSLSLIAKSLRNITIFKKQKELEYHKIAKLTLYTEFILFPVTIALNVIMQNVYSLAISLVMGHTIDAILSHVLIESRFSLRFDYKVAAKLFRFGKYVSGAGVLVYLTTEIDNFFVGKMLGMETLGIYLIAYTMANLPCTHMVNTLSGVVTPAYCKVNNDSVKLSAVFKKVLKALLIIILPASLGIYMLSTELVSVLYGQKWMEASELINILVLFGALRAIAATTGPVFISLGRPDIPFYLIAFKLTAMLVTLPAATYFFGIKGTCWTVSLCMLAEQALLWRQLSRHLHIGLDELARIFLRPVTATLLMAAFLALFKQNFPATSPLAFSCAVLSGAFVYGCSYFFLFNKDFTELRQSFTM